jgi:hypothetical protein
MVRIKSGVLVWIHISKGRFSSKWKFKLILKVDGSFQVIERVNDNACKVDLSTVFQLFLM